jgi:sugar phosphate isomerase/epimerase
MVDLIHRRGFLKTAGAAAAVSLSACAPSLQARPPEIVKNSAGHPRLFSGCCAFSYRQYFQDGSLTMEDFIRKAVELEIDGVDMTTYYLKSTEPSYLLGLRRLAYRNALPFSGAAARSNMCQPDPAKRAEQLAEIRKWVDVTDLLGASHLRVFGGDLPKGASEEQGIQWVVETMKPACDYAATKGVTLGIESHYGITSKAANIVEILRRVDSPFAGCNLDVAHFDEDPYAQIETCIPYATHLHIHEEYGRPPKPLDLDRVWRLLAQGGFKGFASIEYDGKEAPMTAVPKFVAKIKALNKQYSTV